MTPSDLLDFTKAFGVTGGCLAAMVYVYVTRKTEPPGKSRLEEDISELKESIRAIQAEMRQGHEDRHAIIERVIRIETKLEAKR